MNLQSLNQNQDLTFITDMPNPRHKIGISVMTLEEHSDRKTVSSFSTFHVCGFSHHHQPLCEGRHISRISKLRAYVSGFAESRELDFHRETHVSVVI